MQGIYLGSNWYDDATLRNQTGQFEGFLQSIVNSGYMDMLTTAGYNVGRGGFTQGIIDRHVLGTTLNDSTIRSLVQSDVSGGDTAAPDANRLYMVFVEPNVIVAKPDGESVHNFLGYHGAFAGQDQYGDAVSIRYAVMAYPSGTVHNAIVPGLSPFDSETKVASHELVEAVTDPDINYRTLGWYDDNHNEEIGDLANTKFASYQGYVIQYQVNQNDQYIFPTTTTPPVQPGASYNVASFAGAGLWRYDGTSWLRLTTLNATAIGVNAYGDVAAAFAGAGTWEYVESQHNWVRLSSLSASEVAIDDAGDVSADFSGIGLWEYQYGGNWTRLTTLDAALLAMSPNGVVAAEFSGIGVWRFNQTAGWSRLTSLNASILEIDANGHVLTELPGYGVWRYNDGTGWQTLTVLDAVDLAFDHFGDVSAVFRGLGVWVYSDAANWRQVDPVDAASTTFDSKGVLLAEYSGAGLYAYTPATGWYRITSLNAVLLI